MSKLSLIALNNSSLVIGCFPKIEVILSHESVHSRPIVRCLRIKDVAIRYFNFCTRQLMQARPQPKSNLLYTSATSLLWEKKGRTNYLTWMINLGKFGIGDLKLN